MKTAIEIAKSCIARWHDTTDDNIIENIMTTDVADIIEAALAEREAQAVQREQEKARGLVAALINAKSAMLDWQAYASDYMREKWGADKDVQDIDDALDTYNDNRKGWNMETPATRHNELVKFVDHNAKVHACGEGRMDAHTNWLWTYCGSMDVPANKGFIGGPEIVNCPECLTKLNDNRKG